MKHNIRVSGQFATKLQKAKNDAKKWKDVALYFQSVMQGNYRTVRRLKQENNDLKARIAQINTHGDDFTVFMVETIN